MMLVYVMVLARVLCQLVLALFLVLARDGWGSWSHATARVPQRHEGRWQAGLKAGPKSHQLEVRPQRGPRLQVFMWYKCNLHCLRLLTDV